jgi:hypothetical protein
LLFEIKRKNYQGLASRKSKNISYFTYLGDLYWAYNLLLSLVSDNLTTRFSDT